ncbi:MAG: hypothetical protein OHK0039_10690 [Bacteroidia bacterium]
MRHFATHLLWVVALAATSCVSTTIAYEDLRPYDRGEAVLPLLDVVFDEQSFDQIFPEQGLVYTQNDDGTTQATLRPRSTGYADARLLFERLVRDELCTAQGQPAGYALCRVVAVDQQSSIFGMLAAAFTMGASALIGFPIVSHRTYAEVELSIFDNNDMLLGRYAGHASSSGSAGLYYRPRGGQRGVYLKALRTALADIDGQVRADALRLVQGLRS